MHGGRIPTCVVLTATDGLGSRRNGARVGAAVATVPIAGKRVVGTNGITQTVANPYLLGYTAHCIGNDVSKLGVFAVVSGATSVHARDAGFNATVTTIPTARSGIES